MYIRGQIRSTPADVRGIIIDLMTLKEKVEAIAETQAVDDAISILYDILESDISD